VAYGPASLGLPPHSSPVWPALKVILNSPWFKRLWVQPEAAFAKPVVGLCGSFAIGWEVLFQLVNATAPICRIRGDNPAGCMEKYAPAFNIPLSNTWVFSAKRMCQTMQAHANAENYDFSSDMAALMVVSWYQQICIDPRDKVLVKSWLSERAREEKSRHEAE
jgi:hypothetical protein